MTSLYQYAGGLTSPLYTDAEKRVRIPDDKGGTVLSDKCDIKFNLPFGYSKDQPMGDLLPSWANVDLSKITNDKNDKYLDPKMMELEGVVVDDSGSTTHEWPHIAFQDTPLFHYSHDMNFNVKPDEPYKYLLGLPT